MKLNLDLHKENHGIPIGQSITKTIPYPSYHSRRSSSEHLYDYQAIYQRVSGDQLRINVGDIVKLQCSTFHENVIGEFGTVIDRYKIIKNKVNGTFIDYYAVVLMATGKFKGELYHVSAHRLSGLSHKL